MKIKPTYLFSIPLALGSILIGTLFPLDTVVAQVKTRKIAKTNAVTSAAPVYADNALLNAMQWRLMGPFRGGRVVAVAGHPTDKKTFYMGATGGGVWKTTDGGLSWNNISDGYFNMGSVGYIAVSASNPNVVYVGMGEHTLRGNTSPGDGMYKSSDAGKTWKHIGLEDSYHIGKVIVHPTNPDIVYVAAIGHAFGPNEQRGVFRSKDGGQSWKKILYKSDKVGAIDLTIDPKNPNVIYTSTFEFRRFEWGVRSSGEGAGIHKSVDGGDTWKDITLNPGLPSGKYRGRIGLALSPSKPDRVWAIIEAEDNQTGMYRTDDAGKTWKLVSQFAELHQRPWYYHCITADPNDADNLWVMNIGFWKSSDAGKTYARVSTPHGDNHDLWIDPNDSKRMIEGNDGGATVTYDGGKTWSSIYNQPTSQLYHVIADDKFPYRVYGSQQDNSTMSVPVRSDNGAIYIDEMYSVGGGESGYIAFNKKDPKLIFAANHHWITKLNTETNQISDVSVVPEDNYGYGSADIKYRFQWTFPILVSPHNPDVVYAGSSYVHRSVNNGQSWEVISPNLTRSDPAKLERTPTIDDPSIGSDWGPVVRDNTGVEWYGTIFAFEESKIKPGVLWAGSDDGYVHISTDNGKNWLNVTPKDMPDFGRVSIIDPSMHEAGTAYMAVTRYKQDDFKPYIFKTTDYGKSWKKIINGIPEHQYTRVVREDPRKKGLLYAGTERGVHVSFDAGEHWQPLQMNLPVVPIHDLIIKDDALIAGTHGRAIWALDNLGLLRQTDADLYKSAVHLFKPDQTIRFRMNGMKPVSAGAESEAASNLGTNPPNGVVVQYFLKEEPSSAVKLEFIDEKGVIMKSYQSKVAAATMINSDGDAEMRPPGRGGKEPRLSAEKGGNRFVWNDMRYPDPLAIAGITTHGVARGPMVMPGKYKVKLTVEGKSYTEEFDVVKDPRITSTDSDFKEQYELVQKLNSRISSLRQGVSAIRNMREQLNKFGNNDKAAMDLKDKLRRVEDKLVQVKAHANQDLTNYPVRLDTKLISLSRFVEFGDEKPNQQQKEKYEELSTKLKEELEQLETLKKDVENKVKPVS
jgi:photosystem II stability/assembly factor-like uncharacterized protein